MSKYVIFGDATSPHLLKWAKVLNEKVDLYVASSTSFTNEWDTFLLPEKRLSFGQRKKHSGGNLSILFNIYHLYKWINRIKPDIINPHYLTSHGVMVFLLKKIFGLDFFMLSSAWGSDILVTPNKNLLYKLAIKYVLKYSDLCTSDSSDMSEKMRKLGAKKIYTFFFGLLDEPAYPSFYKEKWLFFSNRGLEDIYQPLRVLDFFRDISRNNPAARLIIANKGSLESEMKAYVEKYGLVSKVSFVGFLSEEEQQHYYKKSQWYFSLPKSDSGSVSLLEAMAFGCIPILSNLPANREIIGDNGLIIRENGAYSKLEEIISRKNYIINNNYKWILEKGLFKKSINVLLSKIDSFI